MPAYGSSVGYATLYPGDPPLTLFNGGETVAQGLASIPFQRGNSPSGNDAGSSFIALGMASDMVIDVQAANENVAASFVTTQSITADASGSGGTSEPGRSMFYRLLISAYSSGTMPIVTVKR